MRKPKPPRLGPPPGWLTLPAVADVLGVTPRRAQSLIVRGPLPGAYVDGELMVLADALATFTARHRW